MEFMKCGRPDPQTDRERERQRKRLTAISRQVASGTLRISSWRQRVGAVESVAMSTVMKLNARISYASCSALEALGAEQGSGCVSIDSVVLPWRAS